MREAMASAFRIGLASVRANAVPMAVLWSVAALTVTCKTVVFQFVSVPLFYGPVGALVYFAMLTGVDARASAARARTGGACGKDGSATPAPNIRIDGRCVGC